MFLITIHFDQEIDGKTYYRKVEIKVHPRFNLPYNCEYILTEITLEKRLMRYNALSSIFLLHDYLQAA